jgi:hemoglobin
MCQQTTNPAHSQPINVIAPASHGCGCGGHGHAAPSKPEVGRRVPANHEMEMPEVPFPSSRVLEMVGANGLRRLVRQHHALLRQSEIGHLFAADDAAFATLIERIGDYIVEACGGPSAFTEAHGNTCMRTRHFPFSIDERGREIWLEKLFQAMGDTNFPDELRAEYWAWMEPFTVRMINRRTTKAQPIHLPYAEAVVRFCSPVSA